ncbi:MAG TPA: plasmid pRiA4b ORF-3 family protein [Actinocrinis sp.]|nr:plasmid pRiA4b ORF-3 family protein [Actinocrinis sp.]
MIENVVPERAPGALPRAIVEFVAWLGTGRKLTQTGQLSLADARVLVPMLRTGDRIDPVAYGKTARTVSSRELVGLSLVFSWAKAARLVRVVGGRAVPVAKHGKLLHDEERLSAALLAALPRLGDELAPQGGWFPSPVGADFPAVARLVLDELSAEAAALPAGELHETVWRHVARVFVVDGDEQRRARMRSVCERDVRAMLTALVWLGAVTIEGGCVWLTPSARAALGADAGTARAGDPVLELEVVLRGSMNPVVSRTILLAAATLLPRVHLVLQGAMGWTNSHLHQFVIKGTRYSDHTYSEEDDGSVDERGVAIGELVHVEERFEYEYDFGDSWEHEIVVKRITEADQNTAYPSVAGGQGACPPEDCGGIWAYYEDLLPALADPGHEQYDEYREWLGLAEGGEFDPNFFDLAASQRRARRAAHGRLDD